MDDDWAKLASARARVDELNEKIKAAKDAAEERALKREKAETESYIRMLEEDLE